jgi:hypothetical protein
MARRGLDYSWRLMVMKFTDETEQDHLPQRDNGTPIQGAGVQHSNRDAH